MGKTKEALSTQLSHEQVKRLSGKDVKKFFKRHEAYLSGKTTETLIQSFFMLTRKAIDMVIKVDDVEALQNDLQKDFEINSTLSSVSGNMVLRCGRLVAVANAALSTVWHKFWERTCKGTWKGTCEGNCPRTLERSWLQTCKNFHIITYMAEKSDTPVAAPADAPQVPKPVL